jgi:hypothetical protein
MRSFGGVRIENFETVNYKFLYVVTKAVAVQIVVQLINISRYFLKHIFCRNFLQLFFYFTNSHYLFKVKGYLHMYTHTHNVHFVNGYPQVCASDAFLTE